MRPNAADTAYRRAWWSLAFYPVTFVAAFDIGEGLFSLVAGDCDAAAGWKVLLSFVPALLVFVIPGIVSGLQGRRAIALGRADGSVPAVAGAAIVAGFLCINIASYLAGRSFG